MALIHNRLCYAFYSADQCADKFIFVCDRFDLKFLFVFSKIKDDMEVPAKTKEASFFGHFSPRILEPGVDLGTS